MADACLMVMNPRRIRPVLESLEALRGVDLCYFVALTQSEIREPMAEFVDGCDYRVLLLVSDDVVVTQAGVDNVLANHRADQCTTGYCNLSVKGKWRKHVNLCTEPLPAKQPTADSFSFPLADDVTDGMRTYFAGHCLTAMHREAWQRFPFDCYRPEGRGTGSDYHMCWRMAEAGFPIYAYGPMQQHLKPRWDRNDNKHPRYPLLVGKIPPEVVTVRNG